MTGVHLLRGMHAPRAGSHHIGGSGMTYEETIIRTLGETIERYAQHMSLVSGRHKIVLASYAEMISGGRRVLVPQDLQYFSEAQLARPGFPFSRLEPDAVIGWVSAKSLTDGSEYWVPAQLAFVGYLRHPEEPRFMVGVSTGTAAHTKADLALRSALLELIQIDSAMGHWYGARTACPIGSDARTHIVEELIKRHLHPQGPVPRFYWLPNADLPGLAIACVVESPEIPGSAIGLGCDLRLSRAMYRAFLEGVAVAQLAKVILFRQSVGELPSGIATSQMYDLDLNVGHYAMLGRKALMQKFGDGPAIPPSDMPPDVDNGAVGDFKYLVKGFRSQGKQLVLLDLTTGDTRDLGFSIMRVWSPDTLSLSLPSAPPVMHHRFQAYGGIVHEAPHPYP